MIPEQTSIHGVCNGQVRSDGDSKDGKLHLEGVRDSEGVREFFLVPLFILLRGAVFGASMKFYRGL